VSIIAATDFYKTGHKFQYPEGTEYVYANFTCRSGKNANLLPDWDEKVVFFGLQGMLQELLIDRWRNDFFHQPKNLVLAEYKRRMDTSLGRNAVDISHIEELYELGYLPVEIKALPEGSRVNLKVPLFTIVNTDPRFFWITNYLETQISAEMWKPIVGATIAHEYKRLLVHYAKETGAPVDFVAWQGHDFSMRGMSGIHDATRVGAGHLLSFLGTDTIPAIDYLEAYYGARDTFVGGSVPATEHSVMTMGGEEGELDLFRRLVTKVYPSGIVSIVSDSFDFWRVMTEYAPALKDEILARQPDGLGNAKVVFRPDSGDPVKIICGSAAPVELFNNDPWQALNAGYTHIRKDGKFYELVEVRGNHGFGAKLIEVEPTPEMKGAIEVLWETFGGSYTEKGYRLLNPRVGLIYGDSITLDRAQRILAGLKAIGFASTNVVFGIGSFTYQHVTRDTFGAAIKATWGVVNGQARDIYKAPKTDDGSKHSARGLLRVEREGDDFVLYDRQDSWGERNGELQTVFRNGWLYAPTTLTLIRERLAAASA